MPTNEGDVDSHAASEHDLNVRHPLGRVEGDRRSRRVAGPHRPRGRCPAAFALVACVASPGALLHAQDVVLDSVIAIVNEGVVLQSDLRDELAFLENQARMNRQRLPPADRLRERVIDRLIDVELQRQRAATLGVEVDAESVDQAIAQVADGNGMDLLRFRETLLAEGFDFEQFRDSIERTLLQQRLIQRDVQSRLRVSDQEIEDWLGAEALSARERRRYRVRHLLVAVPPNASDGDRAAATERITALRQRLAEGADFARLAAAESDGARALEGGDLGWRALRDMPRFVAVALRDMEVGDISEVLSSQNGLHLVRVEAVENDERELRRETLARHIFRAGDDPALAVELAALRERIEAGESFAELAEAVSDDPNSAREGGELPWFVEGELPTELERVAADLAPGVVSRPFRTRFGWHILEVLDRRERAGDPVAQRREAQEAIMERKIEQESERWLRELREESFVERLG